MITLLLSLTTALATSFSAHASFTPGAFVAQQCGRQDIDIARKDTVPMQAACVGFIDGTKTRAVQFTLADDSTHLFKVAGQSNLMIALANGSSVTVYRLIGEDGEELTMKAVVLRDGNLKSMSGEFQQNRYSVPVLEQMFNLQ